MLRNPLMYPVPSRFAAWLLLTAMTLAPTSGMAQQGGYGAPLAPPANPSATPPVPGKTVNAAPAAKPKPTAKEATAPSTSGDSGLRQRVDQLEEQLVDLQVVIGTLESLAKSGTAASVAARPMGGGSGPSDSARLDGIEAQIRSLTAQVKELAAEVRGGSARDTGGRDGRRSDAVGAAPLPPARADSGDQGASSNRFGSTTVLPPSNGDPIGSLIGGGGDTAPPRSANAALSGDGAGMAGNAAADPGNAKQLYETAYGYLLQQDYGAAEVAFDDFLKRYPSDSVAGKAQYWLGETYFVRGQYKQAASAFLKGYQTYARSATAPDSLLKFAMSMDRLGQRDAACTSFGEVATRYPTAPAHIRDRAQSERKRVGCP